MVTFRACLLLLLKEPKDLIDMHAELSACDGLSAPKGLVGIRMRSVDRDVAHPVSCVLGGAARLLEVIFDRNIFHIRDAREQCREDLERIA